MNIRATRNKIYRVLESGFDGPKLGRLISGFIVTLIILNVSAVILESYQPIGDKYHNVFFHFNAFSVVVFSEWQNKNGDKFRGARL